ncbi:MAG: ectonucleotide pyrophosphatase/phosphodiesterase [Bryobacteraceae bacterium]|nr:ectonucleotide pyrophosphatase/phosphodiesterase [Bryobacteraceae bacterium]MDW8379533.1 ectonucleotide pyrophosphatase/phosphodiesterase [Bryobacterales bacterium]
MTKICLLIWLFLALPAFSEQRRLILISIDGLKAQTLWNAERLGLKIPNLIEFRDRGAAAEGLLGVFPTVTYPSHTTMVTGVAPATHGIISNTLFDPERKLNGAWFWYTELLKAPTLWQAAKKAGLTTAAVGWPVTAGAQIDYNIPEYRTPRNSDQLMLWRALATPGLLAEYEAARGRPKTDGEHFDEQLSDWAAYLLEIKKPHLLLLHLVDLDHDQHAHGPESEPALRTLENIDRVLGKLRKSVEVAGVASQTRWIIVSDHGFFRVEKALHPEAILASFGLTAPEEDPAKWRVGVMIAGGAAAFVAKDPSDLEAQEQVTSVLRRMKQEGSFGIDRILDRAELSRMNAWPNAFLAISMEEGWTIGSARAGAWVTPSPRVKGTHGYAPGSPKMDCTFIAYGPGVEARKLPRGELRDVAKTAANLLGVSLPTAEGRDLLQGNSN